MAVSLHWAPPRDGPPGEEGWALLRDLGEARVVARSRTTRTERGRLLLPAGGIPVHRKWYDYRALGDRLRGLFRTTFAAPGRARREWDALARLRALGEPHLAPDPVALAEKREFGVLHEAFLATLTLEGGADLGDRGPEPGLPEAAGRAAGRMHAAGFGALDLAPRNLVAAPDGCGGWRVVKVDSGRMREVGRGGAEQARDLAVLLAGLEGRWPEEALAALKSAYAAGTGALPSGLSAALPEARRALDRRRPR